MAEKIEFELVTPVELLVSEPVEMVVVPGGEGDFGVLPGHTPMISTVRPGTIDIHAGGKVTKSIFVEFGFAEVTTERVTVLAELARPVDGISRDDAESRLQKANKAMLEATDPGVRKGAERELLAAEAMSQAVEDFEKRRH